MLSLCAALCLPLSSMAQAISAEDAAFVAATVPVPSPPLRLSVQRQLEMPVTTIRFAG